MKSSASMESKAVGLKILTTTTSSNSKPIFQRNQMPPPPTSYCFLKSCFLCHKHLSLDKNVYMYKGDQGFCSEECRSRQIYIDDITSLEISTKKMIQQFRQSRKAAPRRCDAPRLRETSMAMASPIFL
ncbi:hypothetical protein OSB04_005097 [Centaurea solstitialis]|uniref:FLZ-type domain-containing protein n=1 Tax=Centaurea solstitialis TaxID=347529 RepID=A0AA38WGG7_9ASTR|nr:hypothetical protein OSB04_005097 [Centaurea solstitialis]